MKVTVVTGAATGMGRALCERLLAAGGQIVAVDINASDLQWTSERENAMAGRSPISPAVSKSSRSGEASKVPSVSVSAALRQRIVSYGPTIGAGADPEPAAGRCASMAPS